MWRRLEDVTKEEMGELRHLKKARLYTDEDIEDDFVEALRVMKVNIKSARELGYMGRPDTFHANFAFKDKRFLLTRDTDYLEDKKFPLNRTWGIMILHVNPSNISDMFAVLDWILEIVKYGKIYTGMKIKISPHEVSLRSIDHSGKLVTRRYKVEGGEYYEWIDQ